MSGKMLEEFYKAGSKVQGVLMRLSVDDRAFGIAAGIVGVLVIIHGVKSVIRSASTQNGE